MNRFNILLKEACKMAIELYEDDEAFDLLSDLNNTQLKYLQIGLLLTIIMKLDSGIKVGLK